MSEPWSDYGGATQERGPWSDYDMTGPVDQVPRLKKKSLPLGVYKGVMKPLDNAAMAMEAGARKLGVDTDKVNLFASRMTGGMLSDKPMGQIANERESAIARQRRAPWGGGTVAGEMIGTIPAMMASRNPFIAGGLQGAALTDSRDMGGVAADAVGNAALNWFGGKATQAVSDLIAPVIDPAVRRLSEAGVKLTPGMIKGGKAMVREDKRISRPGVGDAIVAARQGTRDSFNTASVNKILAPIGVSVPTPIQAGTEAIAYAKDAISREYDRVIPNLRLTLDPAAFAAGIAPKVATLEPAQLAQFQKVINSQLASTRAVGAKGQGRAIKDAQGEIRRLASGYSRDQSQANRDLGRALWAADEEFTSALMAQNPRYAPELAKVNEAYRGYRTIADAASRADDGVFNTAQLKQAVRRSDRSMHKDATARGQSFLYEFSNDARRVIPARTPDSGTAGRLNATNLFAQLGGTADAAKFRAEQALAQIDLLPRPQQAEALAALIRKLKAPVGAGAVAFANQPSN